MLSAGFLVPVCAWMLRNYLVTGALDASHFGKLLMARDADPFAGNIGAAGLFSRTVHGFIAYFRETATILLDMSWPLIPRRLRLILSGIAAAPALYGFIHRFRQRCGALEWYFIFYLLIICAWQSHNPRYLLPLIPVAIIFFFASGLTSFLQAVAGGLGNKVVMPILAVFFIFNLGILGLDRSFIRRSPVTPPRTAEGAYRTEEGGELHDLAGDIKWGYWYQFPDWANKSDPAAIAMSYHRLIAASVWMGQNLPQTALAVARKPRLSYWYSGVKTIQYPPTPAPADFARFLRERGVTHLLVDETTPAVRAAVKNFMEERPGELVPVFTIGETSVLEVKKKDEG